MQRVVRSEQGKDVFRHVIDYADSPRIPLHPVFLLELLHGIYFAMFNNLTLLGVQALDDVRQRASFELYPDVLLVSDFWGLMSLGLVGCRWISKFAKGPPVHTICLLQPAITALLM